MKKSIFCLLVLVVFSTLLYSQPRRKIYKGDYIIWKGVFVSSYAVDGVLSAPIISSITYTDQTDWGFTTDKNGYDIWVASHSNINTSSLQCYKFYPGTGISPDGILNNDSIFARTLNGSTLGTTVWIIILGDNPSRP